MSDFYNNLTATASSLLKSYGQQVTFTRVSGGTYDPAEGSVSSTSSITFKGYGAAFNYRNDEINGSTIISGDLKLLLESTKRIPEINDIVTVNSKDYVVVAVDQTNPAGTNVVTKCQLRVGDRESVIR